MVSRAGLSSRKIIFSQIWINTIGKNLLPYLFTLLALYLLHLSPQSYIIVGVGLVIGAAIWTVIYMCVLSSPTAISRIERARPERGPGRTWDVPSQSLFIGRQSEIDRLSEFFSRRDDADPRVAVLYGEPGIGKTALAIHIAHKVSERYPGGQFFARLDERVERGSGVVTPSTHEALAGRVTQLGGDERGLVLLDGATDEAAVSALLRAGPNCAFLITARQPLPGLGSALRVPLPALPLDEAITLLGAFIGEERVASERQVAERIVNQASCQPLAIRLVGASLADEPYASLDLAMDHLLDSPRPGDARRTHPSAFELSVPSLTEEERRGLSMLGLLDQPVVAPWMLQTLLDVDETSVWRIIDGLVRARLLERVSEDATSTALFRFHDQVLNYSTQLLEQETSPSERDALRGALEAARGRRSSVGESRTMETRVIRLLEAGDLVAALQAARDAVTVERDREDRTQEAVALTALAQVHCELGNLHEAEDVARAALATGEALSDRRARRCLGVLMRRKRQFAAGGDYLHKALSIRPEESDEGETVRILRDLAVLQADGIELPLALETVERAQRTAEALPDGAALTAGVWWARGRVLRRMGRLQESEAALHHAQEAAHSCEQLLWEAWIHHERAWAAFEAHQLVDAERHAVSGVGIFARIQHRYGVAHCRLLLGQVFIKAGRLSDASRIIGLALKAFQSCGDPWIQAESARLLAGVRARENRSTEAMRLFSDAASGFARLDDERSLLRVYRDIAWERWHGVRRRVERIAARVHLDWPAR